MWLCIVCGNVIVSGIHKRYAALGYPDLYKSLHTHMRYTEALNGFEWPSMRRSAPNGLKTSIKWYMKPNMESPRIAWIRGIRLELNCSLGDQRSYCAIDMGVIIANSSNGGILTNKSTTWNKLVVRYSPFGCFSGYWDGLSLQYHNESDWNDIKRRSIWDFGSVRPYYRPKKHLFEPIWAKMTFVSQVSFRHFLQQPAYNECLYPCVSVKNSAVGLRSGV